MQGGSVRSEARVACVDEPGLDELFDIGFEREVDDVRMQPVGDGPALFAGTFVGVAGLVGSGRTEMARAIFGADP